CVAVIAGVQGAGVGSRPMTGATMAASLSMSLSLWACLVNSSQIEYMLEIAYIVPSSDASPRFQLL
ncbi:MAG: hypothetical protein WC590_11795, partial [Burkholderiaceae bacterium]